MILKLYFRSSRVHSIYTSYLLVYFIVLTYIILDGSFIWCSVVIVSVKSKKYFIFIRRSISQVIGIVLSLKGYLFLTECSSRISLGFLPSPHPPLMFTYDFYFSFLSTFSFRFEVVLICIFLFYTLRCEYDTSPM
jgi:hypothetical protein